MHNFRFLCTSEKKHAFHKTEEGKKPLFLLGESRIGLSDCNEQLVTTLGRDRENECLE